jgi:glycosidase
MSFHFPIMPRMFMALRLEDRKPLIDIIERTPAIPDSCQWGIFLRNHDELTLEMVTDIERAYMWDEYAQDPRARINLGIRRRLASLMEGDRRRVELMNGLLMSLPGSPIMYYGDEIGMGDNVYLGDRNGVRTPMQWNGGWNAGFSMADPERLWLDRRTSSAAARSSSSSPRIIACSRSRARSGASGCSSSTTSRVPRRPSSSTSRRWPAPFPSRCSAGASSRASGASPTS